MPTRPALGSTDGMPLHELAHMCSPCCALRLRGELWAEVFLLVPSRKAAAISVKLLDMT